MKIKPADATQWYADNGDATLRLDYNLDENSIVIDVGARHGDWSAPILERYNCSMHIFEPWDVIDGCIIRLMNYKNVYFYQYAASTYDGKITMGIEDEEPSIYHENNQVVFNCMDFKKFIIDKKFDNIDLIKINIEGGEYELIEDLIKNNLIDLFDNLQIQFHMIDDYEERYENIFQNLSKTHELTWKYPFIWENWKRKNKEKK